MRKNVSANSKCTCAAKQIRKNDQHVCNIVTHGKTCYKTLGHTAQHMPLKKNVVSPYVMSQGENICEIFCASLSFTLRLLVLFAVLLFPRGCVLALKADPDFACFLSACSYNSKFAYNTFHNSPLHHPLARSLPSAFHPCPMHKYYSCDRSAHKRRIASLSKLLPKKLNGESG